MVCELGRGGFGYVVSPPPVEGSLGKRRDLVGKVFYTDDAAASREAETARSLGRAPGGARWVVAPVPGRLLRRVPKSYPNPAWRGRSVLVMPRMGGTLCAARRVPVAVVWETLAALAWLEGVGVAHLDVKAENVLCSLTASGEVVPGSVRLTDFGLTRRAEEVRGRRDLRSGYAIYPPEVLESWGDVAPQAFPRTFEGLGAEAVARYRPRARAAFGGAARVDVWSWGVMVAEISRSVVGSPEDLERVRVAVRAALTVRASLRPTATALLAAHTGSPSAM